MPPRRSVWVAGACGLEETGMGSAGAYTSYQERKDMLSRSESSYCACCVHVMNRIDMAKLQREAPHTVIR